ncbi:SAG family member [Eimeria mitis]|uniref:SAG family member n=1 Tax=Eimeria mitis TaxID=44415 RepID=U6KBW7_9EIME|nr:SAG family member [Eimeria mitis]CDJ33737.1 SAG family member [Eimeria mitis]
MAPLKIVSLAAASALLMARVAQGDGQQGGGLEEEASPTYTVELGEPNVCLEEINAAREGAGLEHFSMEEEGLKTWPKTGSEKSGQQAKPWDPVCAALIKQRRTALPQ